MRGWYHPESKKWLDVGVPATYDHAAAIDAHPGLFGVAFEGEKGVSPFAVAQALEGGDGTVLLDVNEVAVAAAGWVRANLSEATTVPYVHAPSLEAGLACLRHIRLAGGPFERFGQAEMSVYQADLDAGTCRVETYHFAAARWRLKHSATLGAGLVPAL